MNDIVQGAKSVYLRLIENDAELIRLRKLIESGKSSYEAAQKYSERSGQLAKKAISQVSKGDLTVTQEILNPILEANYQDVMTVASQAQNVIYEAANVNLKPATISYDNTYAEDISAKLENYDDVDEALNVIENTFISASQNYVDEIGRRSAKFMDESGINVLVSREYDDVGVHTTDKGGGDVCQWCLDRCGTDVPYDEAYEMGMFERHPGCGCIITYATKKRVVIQGKGDWETNNWETLKEAHERERRIRKNNSEPDKVLKKWNVIDVKKEYLRNAEAGVGTIKAEDGYSHTLHKDEIKASQWILKNFGGNISLKNESKEDGVHTADYLWDGLLWDLKTPDGNGKRTIDNQFKNISKQISDAPGGMIMDCSNLFFTNNEIIAMTSKRIRLNHFEGDVIIKRDNTVISILRNK